MHRGFRIFSVTLAVVLAIYFTWAGAGRKRPALDIHLHLDTTYEINSDAGKGNVIGVNPYMVAADYASKQHLLNKLDGYMQAAKLKGWLNPLTIVVFPEYIGTWLVVEGEKSSVREATDITRAMSIFVGSNFFSYIRDWFTAPDEASDKLKHSVFSSKGFSMARIYQEVFSELSKKYGVTIIGGSILLPNPIIEQGKIHIRMGPLYNVSAVFNPDGSLQPKLVKKSFPIEEEKPFVASAPTEDIPVFQLPAGRTAVLVCADSWYPETYAALNAKKPFLITVPSFTEKEDAMMKPWAGYSGYPMPADVDSTDKDRISLHEAWMRYTIPTRIRKTSARYGMIATLRGKLWDMGSDGEFIAVSGDSTYTGRKIPGASLVNMYFQ
jgi:predicted amidohydrolase